MIALEQLEQMFAEIREKTPWKVDGPMLWGYFFFDPAEAKLRRLAERLAADGYRIVGVGATDQPGFFRLHAERVETHSPETLYERNRLLAELAEAYGIQSYDGMDVGPVAS